MKQHWHLRRICLPALSVALAAIVVAAVLAQGKGPSVYIISRSQTDTPAKSGQASDEATAASHHLEDQIAIQIQKQYPCAQVTEDRDVSAILKWEHDHALLDANYDTDLSSLAGSLGAKYMVSATVIQTGGQFYMQASCMDATKAQNTAKADMQTNSNGLADSAESLAKQFVNQLGSVFAVDPEDGKTYRGGTVVTAPCSCEGNDCGPYPLRIPEGTHRSRLEITSRIHKGQMINGSWSEGPLVGGADVVMPWRDKCVKVDVSDSLTNETGPAVFTITEPGTYRMRIYTYEWAGAWEDCGNPQNCSGSSFKLLKEARKTQDRYFTVAGDCKK